MFVQHSELQGWHFTNFYHYYLINIYLYTHVSMWISTLTIILFFIFSSLSFSTLVSVQCGPVWDSFTANNVKALEKVWSVKPGCRRSVHMDTLHEKHHWLTLEQRERNHSSTLSTHSSKDSSKLRQSTVPQLLATQKETLDMPMNTWHGTVPQLLATQKETLDMPMNTWHGTVPQLLATQKETSDIPMNTWHTNDLIYDK